MSTSKLAAYLDEHGRHDTATLIETREKAVRNAIQEQNNQVAAGAIGKSPAPAGQAFHCAVTYDGDAAETCLRAAAKTREKSPLFCQ